MKKKLFWLLPLMLLVLLCIVGTAQAAAPNTVEKYCSVCKTDRTFIRVGFACITGSEHNSIYNCTTCVDEAIWTEYREAHLVIPATCTEKQKCVFCNLEDYAWQYNGNATGHSFGAWVFNGNGTHTHTCTNDASHTETGNCKSYTWEYDANSHTKTWTCSVCPGGADIKIEQDHVYAGDTDLSCDLCGYVRTVAHEHYGGTATCVAKAVCEVCGEAYGEIDDANCSGLGSWELVDDSEHYAYCSDCKTHVFENHTSDDSSCTPTCTVCKQEYLDPDGEHSNMTDWAPKDETEHIRVCKDCGAPEYADHSGGTATCTVQAVCTSCGAAYGNPLGHDWGEWESNGDGTHTRTCANDASHTETNDCSGGTATCTEQAKCPDCTAPYGEALGHAPGAEATCTTDQVCTREGCGEVLNEKLGHVPGAAADCTTDQICTRTGCGEVLNEKLDHDHAAVVINPTCKEQGYTIHTCPRCGDSYRTDITGARGHFYDLWSPNGDGTHSAECKRGGCGYAATTQCTRFEVTVKDGETEIVLTVCPVCGEHGETPFGAVAKAAIEAVDGDALPRGERIVRGMDAPFDGVLYAFTAAYEYAGKVEPFGGAVSVALPLDAERYAGFKLVRVDVTPATETAQRTEVWTDVAFTFENGELTFETDAAGLFLLLPLE